MNDFLTCKHRNVQQFTDYCLECGWSIYTTEAEYWKKNGNKLPNPTKYQIPFDKDGNQMHFPESWRGHTMEDNYAFFDTLEFQHFSRGRSAAYAIFKRSTGETVTVFLTDLADMMPRMNNGKVTGKFTFTKKGMNYGTKMMVVK